MVSFLFKFNIELVDNKYFWGSLILLVFDFILINVIDFYIGLIIFGYLVFFLM